MNYFKKLLEHYVLAHSPDLKIIINLWLDLEHAVRTRYFL